METLSKCFWNIKSEFMENHTFVYYAKYTRLWIKNSRDMVLCFNQKHYSMSVKDNQKLLEIMDL